MYKVYADDVLIHDSTSPSKNGHLISPSLSIADNSAGSFTATIPPTNIGYTEVKRLLTTIIVKKNDKTIWTGRVISESVDFWNQRKITAEGALAFLNDINQGLHYYGASNPERFIISMLNRYNEAIDNSKRKIYLGQVTVPDPDISFEYQTNYGSTLDELQNNLFGRLDGHVVITYGNDGLPRLNYYSTYINTSSQTIDFGKNLLDFTRNWSLADLATVIYPRGKALDEETSTGQKAYITIDLASENVNPDKVSYLINEPAYETWGRIEQVVDFSDCENPDILYNLGQAYINSMQFDEITLEVKAIDLHKLVPGNSEFNLLDLVHCTSRMHGLDKDFPIIKIDIPLDHPENVTYTMSYTSKKTGLTSTVKEKHDSSIQAINNITTNNKMLEMTKKQTAEMLLRKTTGYINVVNMYDEEEGEEGVAEAIIISDRVDWTDPQARYWIWNMNGFGYMTDNMDGEGREVTAAIRMDGTIVADRIRAGILEDEYGYNSWNLETGEFRLQPNTQLYYGNQADNYTSLFDLIYDTDKAVNKRTGSANYLNGTKTWGDWRTSGNWTIEEDEALCASKNSATWNDAMKSPERGIAYATIKGYTMSFSIEGSSEDDWGAITNNNVFVVSFCLVNSQNKRIAHCDKAFSFDTDYSRRFTTIDMLDDTFSRDASGNYDTCYIDIWFYNKSKHSIAIRRPQFERGNTPTDWAISDYDVDVEAQNKANQARSDAGEDAQKMDKAVEKSANEFTEKISLEDREYTDKVKQAFDISLNQKELLKRVTNNFTRSGIYLLNGELLINGDYIRTGTLDAGLITAGIIHDEYDNNKWDLTRGYFESRNAHLVNVEADGSFTAGSDRGSRIELYDGNMCFYWDNRYVGSLSAEKNNSRGTLLLDAPSQILIESDNIDINADSLYLGSNDTWEDSITVVTDLEDNGDGFSWVDHTINIVHGQGYIVSIDF